MKKPTSKPTKPSAAEKAISERGVVADADRRTDTTEAHQKAVERVIGHMKTHLEDPLDLAEIARIASMSKFHLVRVFDALTGTTPHHFLACLRIQRAKELLLAPDASITSVCMEVGYASLGTFSKTFSSLVGLSPQEFRAMPKRLSVSQFAKTIWRFLASDRKVTGPELTGTIEGPSSPRGFIFVGTFTGGVPQGVPYSGTVLVKPGRFRIERPALKEFHVMAVLVPFTAKLSAMLANLPVGLVASQRCLDNKTDGIAKPCLKLRPMRSTDPPILLALPALPPLRD